MQTLKFDTKTLKTAAVLIDWDNNEPCTEKYLAKKIAAKLGEETYELLLKLYIAEGRIDSDKAKEIFDEIIGNKECISIRDLKINGSKLKELGISDGKTIGAALNEMLDYAHKNPQNNSEKCLEKYAVEHFLDM
ncbi:hypothetical protein SDC9_172038 [bioreactor metagenome]|uniref:Uncharacterized protein n=1 Tax=bioreactor metagenome TaxID=1076179 RepID=A0A645GCK8_9ZZZZ